MKIVIFMIFTFFANAHAQTVNDIYIDSSRSDDLKKIYGKENQFNFTESSPKKSRLMSLEDRNSKIREANLGWILSSEDQLYVDILVYHAKLLKPDALVKRYPNLNPTDLYKLSEILK